MHEVLKKTSNLPSLVGFLSESLSYSRDPLFALFVIRLFAACGTLTAVIAPPPTAGGPRGPGLPAGPGSPLLPGGPLKDKNIVKLRKQD